MEYFQTPLPSYGDGFCSDSACPCNETRIPAGEGYLYISRECCAFRWDCRTIGEVQTKIERLGRESGTRIMLGPDVAAPILVCDIGARKRGLDLDIAARDAKHWWATERVPFRPTPRVGEAEVAFTSQAATSQTPDREGRAPPSGTPAGRRVRLNKPLVHVLVLKEGAELSGSALEELLRRVAPEVFENSPRPIIEFIYTGKKWPEDPEGLAWAILADNHDEYVSKEHLVRKEYDARLIEIFERDGTRMIMLKVFANRPKTVDSTAPAQQTNIVDASASAQKKDSGWLSTFRDMFATD